MTRLKIKSIMRLLLTIFVIFQALNGVVLDVTAQDATPTIPKPPYIEPEPVKQDVKPGGQVLQGDSLDASSVSTLILASGEASIHGLIYESGFLWASTRTDSAKIIKINPATTPMSVVNIVTLETGRDRAEDIVSANGYIWSIASDWAGSGQGYLVRVDPASMSVQYKTLYIDETKYLRLAESIKYAHGKLWVGGIEAIAEVDVSDPDSLSLEIHDTTWLAEEDYAWATALTSDATHLWAVFTQVDYEPEGLIGSTFARIDPSDLSDQENYTTEYIPSELFPDDMINVNGYLYTSSENSGLPSLVYQISPDLQSITTQSASTTGISYGTFFNPLDQHSFWGSYTGSPGTLIKFDLNMNKLWEFNLPTTPTPFEDPSEIAFDDDGNMYVSTFTNPARLVKYTAPDAVTVSISRSGNDLVLSWSHTDTLVDHYEIWRSTDPYFTAGDAGSLKIADITPDDLVVTTLYTDTASGIGDVNTNYFYLARAFNEFGLLGPFSNRVGEYDYLIHTGTSQVRNDIAYVLNVSGVTNTASLANYLGSFVRRVSRFNPTTQTYQTYIVGLSGTNFSISPGDFLFLFTDSTAPATISLVGGVYDAGSISFSLVSGTPALRNFISLPLDRSDLTKASEVAADIGGGVSRIYRFVNGTQTFQNYIPALPGTDFNLVIGESFGALLTTGAPASWP